jgi:hypothetical protein
VLFSVADYWTIEWGHFYSVSPNDQRFIFMKGLFLRESELGLVINFFEELKQWVGQGND